MKIFFMLAYSKSRAERPVFTEVVDDLRKRGFDVTLGVGQSLAIHMNGLRNEADLYVLKSYSALWHNVAAVLDSQGAHFLNSFAATAATVNKIRAASILAGANIPIPQTWATGDLALISDHFPVMIKPNVGHGGANIRVVRSVTDLSSTGIEDGTLVQELVEPIDEEVKLYVIGERVFGIRKDPGSGTREPIAVDANFEKIALSCGRALGLEIYGVDIAVSRGEPVVIDVNHFPSFRAVPNVVGPLADHIAKATTR